MSNVNRDSLIIWDCPPSAFEKELAGVINRFSRENDSNTPDFVLARYMSCCLDAFTLASRAREKWYGQELRIGNK